MTFKRNYRNNEKESLATKKSTNPIRFNKLSSIARIFLSYFYI